MMRVERPVHARRRRGAIRQPSPKEMLRAAALAGRRVSDGRGVREFKENEGTSGPNCSSFPHVTSRPAIEPFAISEKAPTWSRFPNSVQPGVDVAQFRVGDCGFSGGFASNGALAVWGHLY